MIQRNLALVLFAAAAQIALPCRADTPARGGFVVFGGGEELPSVVEIPGEDAAEVSVDLELGISSSPFVVIIDPPPGLEWRELVAEQRDKRCLSISNSGPHLDLRDWKVELTPWRTMERGQWNKWKSAPLAASDYPGFPAYSWEELLTEVKKHTADSPEGRNGWIGLARSCFESKQSCISECETEIRFSKRSDDGVKVLRTIRILIPMGC